MLFWPSPAEAVAWLEADDEAWARRAAAAHEAAAWRDLAERLTQDDGTD